MGPIFFLTSVYYFSVFPQYKSWQLNGVGSDVKTTCNIHHVKTVFQAHNTKVIPKRKSTEQKIKLK